jgi:hypothetical protein
MVVQIIKTISLAGHSRKDYFKTKITNNYQQKAVQLLQFACKRQYNVTKSPYFFGLLWSQLIRFGTARTPKKEIGSAQGGPKPAEIDWDSPVPIINLVSCPNNGLGTGLLLILLF